MTHMSGGNEDMPDLLDWDDDEPLPALVEGDAGAAKQTTEALQMGAPAPGNFTFGLILERLLGEARWKTAQLTSADDGAFARENQAWCTTYVRTAARSLGAFL
jgi:hypothetical protein